MSVRRTAEGVTFPVDDVEPVLDSVRMTECEGRLSHVVRRRPLAVGATSKRLALSEHGGLIGAAHTAFAEHRPLVLDPDSVWLTIAQGIVQHVSLHAEQYRERLVEHAGERELKVEVLEQRLDDPSWWADLVARFSSLVSEYSAGPARSLFECSFSTTTAHALVASRLLLMAAYQPFFGFTAQTVCGIPEVTLYGTTEDWASIRQRLGSFDEFGLERWRRRLEVVLDQFVAASSGDVDRDFWQRMVKPRELYGSDAINGWIGDLYPYLLDADKRPTRRNPLLERDWSRAPALPGGDVGEAPRRARMEFATEEDVTLSQFPSGVSDVPIRLVDTRGEARNVRACAGVLGHDQDENGRLVPVVGWGVCDATAEERLMERLLPHLEKGEPVEVFPLAFVPDLFAQMIGLFGSFTLLRGSPREMRLDSSGSRLLLPDGRAIQFCAARGQSEVQLGTELPEPPHEQLGLSEDAYGEAFGGREEFVVSRPPFEVERVIAGTDVDLFERLLATEGGYFFDA